MELGQNYRKPESQIRWYKSRQDAVVHPAFYSGFTCIPLSDKRGKNVHPNGILLATFEYESSMIYGFQDCEFAL